MPKTSSLINRLYEDFPHIAFKEGSPSRWSKDQSTIYYDPQVSHIEWIILHELGHAHLNHTNYQRDIQLLAMERDAWEYASTLAPRYNLQIAVDFIEDHLDSYRDWLHKKSTCPNCTITGLEVSKQKYRCPACQNEWKTNPGTQSRIYRQKI